MFDHKPKTPDLQAGAFAGARAAAVATGTGSESAFMLPDGTRQAPAPPILRTDTGGILAGLPPATGLRGDWDDAVLT